MSRLRSQVASGGRSPEALPSFRCQSVSTGGVGGLLHLDLVAMGTGPRKPKARDLPTYRVPPSRDTGCAPLAPPPPRPPGRRVIVQGQPGLGPFLHVASGSSTSACSEWDA